MDVSELDFQTAVLDRSHTVPVVVDFWAEWCGPCRQLGPVIERAVDARAGKVELAKVDVDANPRVAQAFRIQGIPAVKAFRDGEVVAEFTGAQPQQAVERFLDSLLPSEADQLVELGDEASLRRARELEPARADAAVPLARLLHQRGEVDEALQILQAVPGSFAAHGLAARIELERDDHDQLALQEAFTALDSDDRERAIELLMAALSADESANGSRDKLRRVVIGVLDELGADHPLARATRRQLASLLY
ncbi:MAG: tetratricopeptide repeat protein [Actinomycetota bacterium]|nr:tetratricopeptide repeat protein [Actinomycetota bacterium]